MKVQYKEALETRVINEAKLFLESGSTIRSVAESVNMSKSAVAYDLRYRLKSSGRPDLYESVISKLDYNRIDAPFRGAKSSHKNNKNKE